jgi:transposase InsO family protein
MKFKFIHKYKNLYSVRRMCKLLEVSASGYYAWVGRADKQDEQDAEETKQIKKEFENSLQTYGGRRIQIALERQGIHLSRRRINILMKKANLVARKREKWHPQTTNRDLRNRVEPNLLGQDFRASSPNQKWVTDITYIDTKEGWYYLAAVLDLYSRSIVGWGMSATIDRALVISALQMALYRRRPGKGLLHHSDRGSQYTSDDYLDKLEKAGCQISMSGTGNCYDNAAMESFFSTLKTELVYYRFESRKEARAKIFWYIESWYNRARIHSSLGYLSPMEFEYQSRQT